MGEKPTKRYGYHDARPALPPDHARTARVLSDAELEEEILAKRGDPAYQLALLAEAERRAKEDS